MDPPGAAGKGRVSYFAGEDCGRGSAIYWSTRTGARVMQGCIHRDYLNTYGGPGGFLGFPTSDETVVGGGFANTFEGTSCGTSTGSAVYWYASASNVVYGCVYQTYLSYGGPTGSGLGFPTGGQFNITGGQRQNFQTGYITYVNGRGSVYRSSIAYPVGVYGLALVRAWTLSPWQGVSCITEPIRFCRESRARAGAVITIRSRHWPVIHPTVAAPGERPSDGRSYADPEGGFRRRLHRRGP